MWFVSKCKIDTQYCKVDTQTLPWVFSLLHGIPVELLHKGLFYSGALCSLVGAPQLICKYSGTQLDFSQLIIFLSIHLSFSEVNMKKTDAHSKPLQEVELPCAELSCGELYRNSRVFSVLAALFAVSFESCQLFQPVPLIPWKG